MISHFFMLCINISFLNYIVLKPKLELDPKEGRSLKLSHISLFFLYSNSDLNKTIKWMPYFQEQYRKL